MQLLGLGGDGAGRVQALQLLLQLAQHRLRAGAAALQPRVRPLQRLHADDAACLSYCLQCAISSALGRLVRLPLRPCLRELSERLVGCCCCRLLLLGHPASLLEGGLYRAFHSKKVIA